MIGHFRQAGGATHEAVEEAEVEAAKESEPVTV
jgi:hypothetical protein